MARSTRSAPIGDVNPDFRMGLGSNVTFHRAHLYFLFNWQHHGDDINLTELLYDLTGNTLDAGKIVNTPSGPTPLGTYRVTRWVTGNTNVYVQDASFIKLRELSLSYDIPDRLLGTLAQSRAFGIARRRRPQSHHMDQVSGAGSRGE